MIDDPRTVTVRLFCESRRCCGHELSHRAFLADLDRWPRDRMVGAPSTPRRPRRPQPRVAPDEKAAAIARVDAGESVARVAATVGVSRTAIYNWRMLR